MRPKKSTEEVIEAALTELEGWKRDGESIFRSFRFSDFATAFHFMTEVALVAEELNHHPDWTNSYSRVDVTLSTHDAGGLTSLDFELARAMNRIALTMD